MAAKLLAHRVSEDRMQAQQLKTSHTEVDHYAQEVRLGLVLYGGISLAIYMNGVTLEFFRAVRGRGLYGFLKKITNSEIFIDIISGTSAGGINGLFLAFALANRVEFGTCRDLWRKKGGIGSLIGNIPAKHAGMLRDSLFDGPGYYVPALEDAFRTMLRSPPDDGHNASPAPDFDLDLFITGTDFYGEASTQFDDAGHPIDLMNYRTVFQLRHRTSELEEGRSDLRVNNPSSPSMPAFGKLAAITSCFPAAFPPVAVGPDGNGEDSCLRKWGGLDGSTKFFVDGGVLANKPFTPTIQAIFKRSADRVVDRYLCYVEPNPEPLQEKTSAPVPIAPDLKQTALGSLSTLPRFQSISGDLMQVASHNTALEQYTRMCKAARNHIDTAHWKPSSFYQKARLLSLTDRVLAGIFRDNGRDPIRSRSAKEAACRMVNCFEDSEVDHAEVLLPQVDIYFHQRRLTHLTYWASEKLNPANRKQDELLSDPRPAADISRDLRHAKRAINGLKEVADILQDEMESLIDKYDFKWESRFSTDKNPQESAAALWLEVYELLFNFLDCGDLEWPDPANMRSVRDFRAKLRARASLLKSGQPTKFIRTGASFLSMANQKELNVLKQHARAYPGLLAEYEQFEMLDDLTFPAELMSGLVSKDSIRTIRFSPLDAKLGASGLKPKILGRQFGAFGGFLKESWRSNDILFGRFDGACQLTELLLGENSKAKNKSAAELAEIRASFFELDGSYKKGRGPADYFPHCDAAILEPSFRAAIGGCWTPAVIQALIEAEQHEIFADENAGVCPAYGTLLDYLRTKYPVRNEGAKNLLRLASIPVALKVSAAAALVGLGMLLRKFKRTRTKFPNPVILPVPVTIATEQQPEASRGATA